MRPDDGFVRAFSAGFVEPLASPPVVLVILAAALAAAIWRGDALLRLWATLAAGTVAGAAIAFTDIVNPLLAAFTGVILLGLLGALGSPVSVQAMRVTATLAGAVLAVSALGWHAWAMAPATSYTGTLVALNAGFAIACGVLGLLATAVKAPWMPFALRAVSSWLVAIALMMAALYWKDGLFNV